MTGDAGKSYWNMIDNLITTIYISEVISSYENKMFQKQNKYSVPFINDTDSNRCLISN